MPIPHHVKLGMALVWHLGSLSIYFEASPLVQMSASVPYTVSLNSHAGTGSC